MYAPDTCRDRIANSRHAWLAFAPFAVTTTDWDRVPHFGLASPDHATVVRPSAYGLLFDARGRIALADTPQGLLLLGGGIDDGERPERTVVREAREEVGLSLSVGSWRRRAVETIWSPRELKQFEKRSVFVDATIAGATVTPIETDHLLRWLDPTEAMGRLWHESHRWAIAEYLASRERM